jgi:hypothetical protein
MSARQVRLLQMAMIAGFYGLTVLRRPARLFEFIRSQVTGRELTYLDQMVRTKRRRLRPSARTAERPAKGRPDRAATVATPVEPIHLASTPTTTPTTTLPRSPEPVGSPEIRRRAG